VTFLRGLWAFLSSRAVFAAALLGAALIVAGEIRNHLTELETSTAALVATPTRRAQRWPTVRLPAELEVPSPPVAELEDARKRWGRPDLVSPEAAGAVLSPDLLARLVARAKARAAGSGQQGSPAPPSDASGPEPDLLGGQIQRAGAVLLNEVEDRRAFPNGVEAASFLELDGKVTTKIKPRAVKFFGAPFRWRFDGWAAPFDTPVDYGAGVTFRTLRMGRVELGPGLRLEQVDGAARAQVVLRGSLDL